MTVEAAEAAAADDYLFSPHALPVEAFGVFSGEAELLIEDVAPLDVHITQTFGEQSTLLWSSSVVLAQQWWRGGSSLPEVSGRRVLELGAGLGLNAVGLAAKGALVVATEVEPALSALRQSVARNRQCWAKAGGTAAVEVCELRWGETGGEPFHEAFDVVVGTDLLYSRELRAPLLRTLQRVVGPRTTVVLALEARGDELAFLSQAASQLGMAARCAYGPDERGVEIHVLGPPLGPPPSLPPPAAAEDAEEEAEEVEKAAEEAAEEQGAGGGRRAGSGAGWREIFLDAAEAACCGGVLRAVLAGHSVLVLEAVASDEECAALVAEAGGLARRELEVRDTIVFLVL